MGHVTNNQPITDQHFLECDASTRTKALLEVVHNKLPKVNFLVFERLVYHLAQVAKEVSELLFSR